MRILILPLLLTGTPLLAAPALNCHVPGLRAQAHCGQLSRPLDPARPQGVRIDIHYVVAPAKDAKPGNPVFFLAGGPGQSAIRYAGPLTQLLADTNLRHDLVFIDQRGTGKSAPLACRQEWREGMNGSAYARQCLAELRAKPWGQPQFYTTSIAVQDMEAIRARLGYGQAHLLGVSYGTRVALEWQRQYPASVARLLLDSVVPPDINLPVSAAQDADQALSRLLQRCEQDQDCQRRYPDLARRTRALLDGLPQTVALPASLGLGKPPIRLERSQVLDWLRAPLYTPATSRALPAALDAAARGNWLPLAGLAQQGVGQLAQDPLALAMGMHLSASCSEDMPLARGKAASGAWFGDSLAASYRELCAAWPATPAPAAFYKLSQRAAASWLLAGADDPITPPRHARRLAPQLGALTRVSEIPNAGHNVISLACLPQAAAHFFDAKTEQDALRVDASCVQQLPPASAFIPPGTEPSHD